VRVVVLVPRRDGFADRDRLWAFARTWWEHDQPDWEIVEGHHLEHEGPFNRAMAINRAATAAGIFDVAVIIDSDVLCNPAAVRDAVALAHASDQMVLGYNERISLSKHGTGLVMDGYRGNWRKPSMIHGIAKDACSSCVVVSRKLWDQVGGFDEEFKGWGWEDVAFRVACETASGRKMAMITAECWHLHHVVSGGNNPLEDTFIQNRVRGERYRAAHWDLEAVQKVRDNILDLPPSTIPRILHRTVPENTTEEVERWWRGWELMHPGWELRTYRDPLDPEEWETSWIWPECETGAQLAGLIRLEALWRMGGVYVDSDVECFRSLESLLSNRGFAAWEDRNVIPDAVMGAEPGHPAVKAMLDLAQAAVQQHAGTWESGPGVLTHVLPGRTDWLLLPPGSFYPYHYSEKHNVPRDLRGKYPWAFGAHHWAASWVPPDKKTTASKRPAQRRRAGRL
jgi:hypothetical protein